MSLVDGNFTDTVPAKLDIYESCFHVSVILTPKDKGNRNGSTHIGCSCLLEEMYALIWASYNKKSKLLHKLILLWLISSAV